MLFLIVLNACIRNWPLNPTSVEFYKWNRPNMHSGIIAIEPAGSHEQAIIADSTRNCCMTRNEALQQAR